MAELNECFCDPPDVNCKFCNADVDDDHDHEVHLINEIAPAAVDDELVKKKTKGRVAGTVNWTFQLHMEMLGHFWSGDFPESFDSAVGSPEFRAFATRFITDKKLNQSVPNLHGHIIEMIRLVNGAVSFLSSKTPPVLKPPTSTLR
jgi:hypothetical protein